MKSLGSSQTSNGVKNSSINPVLGFQILCERGERGRCRAGEVLDKVTDVKVNMKSELTTLTFLLHVPDRMYFEYLIRACFFNECVKTK